MRMLVTTSDGTPTRLCWQAGDGDFSPSRRACFWTDDLSSQYSRRMIRGFRTRAFSATSSDLLRAWSVSVKSISEVVSGLVQATKQWCSDRGHKRVTHVTIVKTLCTVYVPSV